MAPPHCRNGPPLELELERWSAALRSSKSASRRNQLLAKLGLDPVPDGMQSEDSGSESAAPAELDSLELIDLTLRGDPGRDRAVVIRYSSDDGRASVDHLRARVLLGREGGYWCRAEPAFQVDQGYAERACLGVESGSAPLTLRPLRLLEPARDALELKTHHGECDGCGRSGTHMLEFYVERNEELVQVFQHTLYHATYSGCPFPPVKETRGSVRLGGGFPKEILATTEVICSEPDADLPKQYRQACTPEKRESRHHWSGQAYAAQ